MKTAILRLTGCALFLGLQACTTPVTESPWDLARGSRPATLQQREVQVRTHMIATEEDVTGGEPYVDVHYGARDNLTLTASLGESLRRSAYTRGELPNFSGDPDPFAPEVGAIGVNYGLSGNFTEGGTSLQMQVVLPDGSGPEFRPSFGWQNRSFAARVGVNLADRLDERFFLEGAYWHPLGDFLGLVEFDAILGDVEGRDFDEIYVSPGVVAQLRELVQFQLSVPVGLTSESADWQMLAGFVFRM